MPLQPNKKIKINEKLLSDPFGDETRKYRRNVLVFSLVGILVELYNVSLKDSPYVVIDAANDPDLVKGLLSIIVLYQLLVFISYCWVDFRRWYFLGDILVSGRYFEHIITIESLYKTLQLNIERIKNLEVRNDLAEVFEKGIENVGQMDRDLIDIHKRYRNISWSQWARMVTFDVGIPLLVGLYAMYLLGKHVPVLLFGQNT